VDEIMAAGGDAIAVGGDVAADDFPVKILDATIKYATLISPLHTVTCPSIVPCFRFIIFLFPGGMAS